MNRKLTRAIVLGRTNYGEADRILNLLTPDYGKLSAMAKGVRRERSKMAGGVELFSISEIGFIEGKSELVTLTSTRLVEHFDKIVQDIERTMLGYEILKIISKTTEHSAEPEYFEILSHTLNALNDVSYDLETIQIWFNIKLLKVSGHSPNLINDDSGKKLEATFKFSFDNQQMNFTVHKNGLYSASHIKLLRLAHASDTPAQLLQVKDVQKYLTSLKSLTQDMRKYHLNT